MDTMPVILTEEVWSPIPSCAGYSVSSFGRVRRDAIIRGNKGATRFPKGVLSQRPLPSGHMQVTISIGNQPRTLLVHRLVAEVFLPAPSPGQDCVCHVDDDPSYNVPSNLFWGTKADNSRDMVSKGRQVKGERITGAKLNPEKVTQIRLRAATGENQYELAREFAVTQSSISMIVSRITWRHVV